MSCIKTHHDCETVVTSACTALGKLAGSTELAIMTGAASAALIGAMLEYAASSDVQENCCVTINKLVYSDGKTVSANQDLLGKGTSNPPSKVTPEKRSNSHASGRCCCVGGCH